MADSSSIDNSLLISLIEKYPILWDKTTEFYKNRAATQAAWKQVIKSLNPESLAWDDVTSKAYDKLIKQRWTHIRDNYYRSYRKLQEQQMTGTRATKPYLYSKRLTFLRKIMPGNESLSSEVDIKTENQNDSESIDISENSLEDNDIGTIHSTLENMPSRPSHNDDANDPISTPEPSETNRHLLFFKGVLPSLVSFDDNETIDFQMGVLQLLKKIKNSRQSQQLPSYNIKYEDTSNSHDGYSS